MNKKLFITITINLLFFQFLNAQLTTNYDHCNCKETINYSESNNNVKNGEYLLNCSNSLIEKGNYKNGNKDGIWTVKNKEGKIVSKIEFTNGKLNGIYELFNYDGKPKLKAEFDNNIPKGEWTYFNKKGKLIKQGTYTDGKPNGIWKIYDKKGKKVVNSYDFDKNKSLITSESKIKDSYLPREDESGEYIIIYYPKRKHLSDNVPFEGNILSNKEFIDLLNVPFILMNTYTDYNFKIKAKIENGNLVIENVEYLDNVNSDSNILSFPYIAQTNSPNKLKTIKHSELTINKMKERIFETLMILGPWTSNTNNSFEIHIPFVLNNVNR